jgi:hypothetical protein
VPEQNALRRCPNCGALASADAEWCGQCFASLAVPESEPAPVLPASSAGAITATAVDTDAPAKHAVWPCPLCEHENPIEFSACEVCGTTFATLMRRDDKRPTVEPRVAAARSLVFPGLGHGLVGQGGEGFARGVLFVVMLTMSALLLFSGVRTGPAVTLVALYVALTVGLYLGSAYEAYRMAQGSGPIVSGRILVLAMGGLIMATALVFAFGLTAATRR